MKHVLTKLIKLVVVDSSTYVNFNAIYQYRINLIPPPPKKNEVKMKHVHKHKHTTGY